tara:strand:+ start:5253 stop:7667 length:2415 start_codon:yes stop_codon:yes gene_type:complete
MKRLLLLGLIFILTGCGAVASLFDDDDVSDALTAIASGDITFLKENINDVLDVGTETPVDCTTHLDDVQVSVYQTDENEGNMFLKSDFAEITEKADTIDSCTFSYKTTNLDSGLTTVESTLSKVGKDKQIVQRVSDSLEENKTNILETITKETSEICDRVIPIILEKYSDTIQKDKLNKLSESEMKIYIDIIVDTVKETIGSLKAVHGFQEYDVTTLKPIEHEFIDTNTNRVIVKKFENSSFTKNDYSEIKNACEIDNAGKNYIDMIELEYNMKHNRKDEKYAKNIIEEVFGEEMIENHPAAIELMADAYKQDNKVTLEEMADAIFVAMDFDTAKEDDDITIGEVPENSMQILQFIKAEITQEDGLVHDIFDDYEDTNRTYRDRYRHKEYKTSNDREGLMTTKGIRSVFSEDHRWNDITEVNNTEKVDILEVWTLIMMAMDEGQLHEDHLDMSKFFYTLGILDMDKAFVVDVFIEKDESKELIITVVDTQNKIVKVKATVQLTNDNETKIEIIEISDHEKFNYDKEFKSDLAAIELDGYTLKSGEIKVELLDANNNIVNTHKQDLLDFSDIFQTSNDYSDYYAGFDYSDDDGLYIENVTVTDDAYINYVVEENHYEDYGTTYSTEVETDNSIKDKDLNTDIDNDWIYKEGTSLTYVFDESLMIPNIDNDYLEDYELTFEYKIEEIVKPVTANEEIENMYSMTSHYNVNEIKYWNNIKFNEENSALVEKASRVVAEGELGVGYYGLVVDLPLLEPNTYNDQDNYYTHYELCVRNILLDSETDSVLNRSVYKCFPYFIEEVTYTQD